MRLCACSRRVTIKILSLLQKVLTARHNRQPRVINVDKNVAYSSAIDELREDELLEENS